MKMGRLRTLLGALLLATAVAGCGDGIEIKSPLLNTVASSLGAGQKKEPQLADRPGIVIPPSTAALPPPGSGQAVNAAITAQLPKGPEQMAAAAAAEKKKQEDEACKQAANNPKGTTNGGTCPGLLAKLLAAAQGGQSNNGDQPQ